MAIQEIEQLLRAANRDDLILIFFSGHGYLDYDNELWLCFSNTTTTKLTTTAYHWSLLDKALRHSPAKAVTVILDCCFSGAAKDAETIKSPPVSGQGRFRLASCLGSELAKDASVDGEPSPFTALLLEALSSLSKSKSKQFVSLADVTAYVEMHANRLNSTPNKHIDGAGDVPLLYVNSELPVSQNAEQLSASNTNSLVDTDRGADQFAAKEPDENDRGPGVWTRRSFLQLMGAGGLGLGATAGALTLVRNCTKPERVYGASRKHYQALVMWERTFRKPIDLGPLDGSLYAELWFERCEHGTIVVISRSAFDTPDSPGYLLTSGILLSEDGSWYGQFSPRITSISTVGEFLQAVDAPLYKGILSSERAWKMRTPISRDALGQLFAANCEMNNNNINGGPAYLYGNYDLRNFFGKPIERNLVCVCGVWEYRDGLLIAPLPPSYWTDNNQVGQSGRCAPIDSEDHFAYCLHVRGKSYDRDLQVEVSQARGLALLCELSDSTSLSVHRMQ